MEWWMAGGREGIWKRDVVREIRKGEGGEGRRGWNRKRRRTIQTEATRTWRAIFYGPHLWGELYVREGRPPHELDPVAQRRGGGVGPAGSAVLRDVLIPVDCGVVHAPQSAHVVVQGEVLRR